MKNKSFILCGALPFDVFRDQLILFSAFLAREIIEIEMRFPRDTSEIVESGGSKKFDMGMLSKPMTETSSGHALAAVLQPVDDAERHHVVHAERRIEKDALPHQLLRNVISHDISFFARIIPVDHAVFVQIHPLLFQASDEIGHAPGQS